MKKAIVGKNTNKTSKAIDKRIKVSDLKNPEELVKEMLSKYPDLYKRLKES